MNFDYAGFLIKHGYRAKDFCLLADITIKTYYAYFKGNYTQEFLFSSFPKVEEALNKISGKDAYQQPTTTRIQEMPILPNYYRLTRGAGLRTVVARSRYFGLNENIVLELEYAMQNKHVPKISERSADIITKKLTDLSILFVL